MTKPYLSWSTSLDLASLSHNICFVWSVEDIKSLVLCLLIVTSDC
jgi:hypothetical protein